MLWATVGRAGGTSWPFRGAGVAPPRRDSFDISSSPDPRRIARRESWRRPRAPRSADLVHDVRLQKEQGNARIELTLRRWRVLWCGEGRLVDLGRAGYVSRGALGMDSRGQRRSRPGGPGCPVADGHKDFLAGGLWKLRGFPLPMAPTLIIVLGAVLLGRTVDSYARPRRGRLDTAIPIVLPRCSWELSQTAARRSVVPARASAGRGPRGIAQNWVAGELG